MTIQFFKRTLLFLGVASLGFLAACGSDSKTQTSQNQKAVGTSNCTGNFVPGGTITCIQPKDFVQDCQCFFQTKGMEFYTDCQEANDGLNATLPLMTGQGELGFRCGADGFVPIETIDIKSAPKSTDTAVSGGENTIAPVGGGSAPSDPTAVCTTNDDCVHGTECRGGRCSDSLTPTSATPPPASTPPPAEFSATLDGDLVEGRYGLAHLQYQIQGGGTLRAKYVYFPTSAADCTHGLVTDQHGNPLRPGTSVYDSYHDLDSGTACTSDENCRDFSLLSDPASPRPLPTFCRIELPAMSGDFYVKLLQPGKYFLIAQGEDGSWKQRTKEFAIENALMESTSVTFNEHEPKIDIVAQASRTPHTIAITMGEIDRHGGCTPTTLVDHVSPEGHAEFTGSCPFHQKDATISIRALGLGGAEGNAVEQYRVHCEDPQPTLRTGGDVYAPGATNPGHVADCAVGTSLDRWWEHCNAPIELNFNADVSRVCTVSKVLPDGTTSLESSPTVRWVKSIQIEAYPPASAQYPDMLCSRSEEQRVTSWSGAPLLTARLPRNHDCLRYKAIVRDFDDREFRSEFMNLPYKYDSLLRVIPSEALHSETSVQCRGNDLHDCGSSPGGACGWSYYQYTRQDYLYEIEVQNLRTLRVENPGECFGRFVVKNERHEFVPPTRMTGATLNFDNDYNVHSTSVVYFQGDSVQTINHCQFIGVDWNYVYSGSSGTDPALGVYRSSVESQCNVGRDGRYIPGSRGLQIVRVH